MMIPLVRLAQPSDAEALLALMKQLDNESAWMMLERRERTTTVEDLSTRLVSGGQGSQPFWVAEAGGKLIGYVSATRGEFRRNRHSAWLVIGVVRKQSGKGLGTRLPEQVGGWARSNSVSRLELTVMVHNQAAIRLYRKMGFSIEGVRHKSLYADGAFVDEYQMARLLES